MSELNISLQELLQSIEHTTDLFYQQKIEDGYIQIQNTVNLLYKAINNLYLHTANGNDIGFDGDKIVRLLTDAMNAMEEKDTILLSDILQYELKEEFEKILEALS